MITVKATREGLIGHITSSGYIIDSETPYVALPSRAILWDWIRITNPANGKTIEARVLDVGPHFTNDNDYVFGGLRPRAEIPGYGTNGAGIDLGEKVWTALGMTDNTEVSWERIGGE